MKTLNKTIFGILVILGITLVFAQVKSTNEIVFCENTNPNKFLDDAISKIQKIHPAVGVNTCVRLETSSKISATARNNPDEIVLTTGLMNRLKEEEEKKVNSGEAILVFILSHELGHFALKHSHSCSDSNAKESERQADLYGAFLTFVTGFDSSLLSPLKTVLPNSENDSCHDNIKERVATLHTKSDKFREQARKFEGIMELVSKYNTAEQADELEKKANEIKKIQEEIFTKEKVGKDIPILTLALATIYHKSWILKYPSYDELSYMATIYFPVDLTSDTTRGVNRQNLTMEYYDARGMYKSYLEKVPNDSKVMMNYLLLLMYDEDGIKEEKITVGDKKILRFPYYYNLLKQSKEKETSSKYLNNLAIIAMLGGSEEDKKQAENWLKEALKFADNISDKNDQKEMRTAIHFNLAKFYFDREKKSKNYEENVSAYIALTGGCNASKNVIGWLEVVGVNCAGKNEKDGKEEPTPKKREGEEVITGIGEFKLDMSEKDLKILIKKQGLGISSEKPSGEKNKFNSIEVKKNNKLAYIFKIADKKVYAIQVFSASEEKVSGITFGEYYEEKPDKTQKIDGKDTRYYLNRNLKLVFDNSGKVEEITIQYLK